MMTIASILLAYALSLTNGADYVYAPPRWTNLIVGVTSYPLATSAFRAEDLAFIREAIAERQWSAFTYGFPYVDVPPRQYSVDKVYPSTFTRDGWNEIDLSSLTNTSSSGSSDGDKVGKEFFAPPGVGFVYDYTLDFGSNTWVYQGYDLRNDLTPLFGNIGTVEGFSTNLNFDVNLSQRTPSWSAISNAYHNIELLDECMYVSPVGQDVSDKSGMQFETVTEYSDGRRYSFTSYGWRHPYRSESSYLYGSPSVVNTCLPSLFPRISLELASTALWQSPDQVEEFEMYVVFYYHLQSDATWYHYEQDQDDGWKLVSLVSTNEISRNYIRVEKCNPTSYHMGKLSPDGKGREYLHIVTDMYLNSAILFFHDFIGKPLSKSHFPPEPYNVHNSNTELSLVDVRPVVICKKKFRSRLIKDSPQED